MWKKEISGTHISVKNRKLKFKLKNQSNANIVFNYAHQLNITTKTVKLLFLEPIRQISVNG